MFGQKQLFFFTNSTNKTSTRIKYLFIGEILPFFLPILIFFPTVTFLTPSSATSAADFVDVASKAGLTANNIFGETLSKKYILESTGTGVAIFDYDNDGWPDIFLVNGTTLKGSSLRENAHSHLYHNNHDGTFTDVTEKAGLMATGWGQGVCVGDYDNDGWEDLYITYYGKNRLYHNRGNGTFEEVADKIGVTGDGRTWGSGCAFLDYDRDGRLDLIVANYVDFDLEKAPSPGAAPTCQWKGIAVFCGPRGLPGAKNTLYHNRGDRSFENVTRQARIDQTLGHYCFSVTTLDFDDDGWPDIYVACDSTPSILYHNNHDGTFADVGITSGAAYNEDGREQAGMGSTAGDYDGDGKLDIFRTNFSDDTSTLYHNNGNGTFSDVTYRAGLGRNTQYLGWGVTFMDFDNDGWPDLLLANGHVYPEVDSLNIGIKYQQPRLLYHNNGDGTFADLSKTAGSGIGTPSSGRGLAIGDLWNDGRLSAVIANMNAQPSLLLNQARYPNHWIAFKTVGTLSNRDGIGTRLKLKTSSRILVDEVRSGSSYISNNDMRVHFGLGPTTKIEYLEVQWPSALIESFRNLPVDAIVTVKEGTGERIRPSEQGGTLP
jgi:enediyne biosynthesis protein E4